VLSSEYSWVAAAIPVAFWLAGSSICMSLLPPPPQTADASGPHVIIHCLQAPDGLQPLLTAVQIQATHLL
jgi:hypothetical protein